MISGFQNHLHVLYGFPGGWADNSDVLGGAATKRRRRQEQLIEEQIAAQLLQAQLAEVEIPKQVSQTRLIDVLKAKLYETPAPGEVTGDKRATTIRYLLIALAMEDD